MNKTLPALPGKAPALPPGAFEIGYTAQDGAQHRVPLAGAAVVRFADTQPARRIRTRKGQRHLPGRWWWATDGRHIGYESWLERDQLMWLDWDRAVTGTASQPFRLRWTTEEGEPRSHVPDYCQRRRADDRPWPGTGSSGKLDRMTAQAALKAAVRDIAGPAACAAGFKGSGSTWRPANSQGDWAVVKVQSSSWSTARSLRCVIDVAVALAPWLDWMREWLGSLPKSVNESLGLCRERLHLAGAPAGVDGWWLVSSD